MRKVLQKAILIGLLSFSGHVTVQSFLPVNQKLGPVATTTKYSAPELQKHFLSAGRRNSDASLYAVTASKEDSIVKDFMGKNKLEFFKLAIIALVATVSAVSVPLYFSKVLDALTSPIFDLKRLMRPLSMMLLCHVVEPIMTIFYVRKCSLLIDIFVSNLRMAVYSNILRRDVSTFELNSPMSSSQLVTGEIDKIKVSAMSNISRDRGLRSVLELLSGLGILYTLCLPLALFFSTIIPMTAFVTSRFADGLFVAAASESKATTQQANRAIETISNFKEVYSFSNQPLEEKRFQEMQSVASGTALKTGLAKALFEAANRAGIYFNILSLFAVGGLLVQRKAVLPTVLVSFIGYCFSLNFATQGLLFSFGDLRSAGASWQKIQNFLKETASPPSSAHHTAAVSMDTAAPPVVESHRSISDSQAAEHTMDISFKGVSFSYKNRPDVVVLNNIDLSIPRGKMTALVGPSGAGKSTIAALLNRFYQPSSGTLSVNGVNSEDISAEEYLQHVSVVRQSPALFTDTVANNIGIVTWSDFRF
jgi:ATP-binding cassette, subfamily B (MDR/TAP), member 10